MIAYDPFSSSVQAGASVLGTISEIGTKIQQLSDIGKQKSLIELSSPARVEPLTIVGADCVNLEYIGDVMQSLTSIFSGYYLQAVNAVCSLKSAQAMKNLDRLNPHRQNPFSSGLAQLATETLSEPKNKFRLAFESAMPPSRETVEFKSIDVVKDNANLSVGKLVEVTIQEDKTTVKIPIAIRLMAATVPEATASQILSINVQDNSFAERWHGWRSGRLSFIRDLLLCQDLIDQHKKAMMKDKTGIYRDIINTANQNKVSALLDEKQRGSLASASNLFVISEATAEEIEERGNGKLSDMHFRAKVFDSGYAMIIAVIDRQRERVRFYHRGIAQVNNVGIRDLKSANKGAGIDVHDVMKAFVAGSNPSF